MLFKDNAMKFWWYSFVFLCSFRVLPVSLCTQLMFICTLFPPLSSLLSPPSLFLSPHPSYFPNRSIDSSLFRETILRHGACPEPWWIYKFHGRKLTFTQKSVTQSCLAEVGLHVPTSSPCWCSVRSELLQVSYMLTQCLWVHICSVLSGKPWFLEFIYHLWLLKSLFPLST